METGEEFVSTSDGYASLGAKLSGRTESRIAIVVGAFIAAVITGCFMVPSVMAPRNPPKIWADHYDTWMPVFLGLWFAICLWDRRNEKLAPSGLIVRMMVLPAVWWYKAKQFVVKCPAWLAVLIGLAVVGLMVALGWV